MSWVTGGGGYDSQGHQLTPHKQKGTTFFEGLADSLFGRSKQPTKGAVYGRAYQQAQPGVQYIQAEAPMQTYVQSQPEPQYIIQQPAETQYVVQQPMEQVIQQPMETQYVTMNQPAETQYIIREPSQPTQYIEQPMETQYITVNQPIQQEVQYVTVNQQQPVETQYVMQEPVQQQVVQQVVEQPVQTQYVMTQMEQPVQTQYVMKQVEQPVQTQYVTVQQPVQQIVEQPIQRVISQPVQTQVIQQPIQTQLVQQPVQTVTQVVQQPAIQQQQYIAPQMAMGSSAIYGGGITSVTQVSQPNFETARYVPGVEMQMSPNGQLVVVAIDSGTSAWDSALKVGDRVLSIDGQSVSSVTQAKKLLAGDEGTLCTIATDDGDFSVIRDKAGAKTTQTFSPSALNLSSGALNTSMGSIGSGPIVGPPAGGIEPGAPGTLMDPQVCAMYGVPVGSRWGQAKPKEPMNGGLSSMYGTIEDQLGTQI